MLRKDLVKYDSCFFDKKQESIEKAVNNYNVKNARIDHADNVNIDMSGAVKEVLDFVGDQIKEGREDRPDRFHHPAVYRLSLP